MPFNVTLNAGANTITVFGEDGPFGAPNYQGNPAGVVFGGILHQAAAPDLTAIPVSTTEGILVTNAVVAHFTDPHPNTVASDFTASVTWDTGETRLATVQADPSGGYFVLASQSNAFAEAGPHAVHVVIGYDPAGPAHLTGGTVFVDSPVTVADAPLIDETMSQTLSGDFFMGTDTGPVIVATFLDANPLTAAADFGNTTIDWGDGSTADPGGGNAVSLQVVSRSSAGTLFNVVGHHSYADAGAYPVTVTAIDSGGQRLVIQDISIQVFVNGGT